MYYNNKGSVLIFVLIVFSIVSTITMMCIGLNYSNSKISNFNYERIIMREYLLSSIELVHSNILKEVSECLENSDTNEEFTNYFLGNTFLNNIKNISNSGIKYTSVRIPSKINIDSSGIINFQIESTIKNKNYTKKYIANVKIDTNLSNYISNGNECYNNDIQYINTEAEVNLENNMLDNNDLTLEDIIETDVDDSKSNCIVEDNNKDLSSVDPKKLVKVYDYKEI